MGTGTQVDTGTLFGKGVHLLRKQQMQIMRKMYIAFPPPALPDQSKGYRVDFVQPNTLFDQPIIIPRRVVEKYLVALKP